MARRSRVLHGNARAAIPAQFSRAEVARIDSARALLGLRSRSAFIRDAVLETLRVLETTKVVEVRDFSKKEAIRMIDRFLSRHPGVHHVDEIADELGIELPVAFAAAEELLSGGRARVRGN